MGELIKVYPKHSMLAVGDVFSRLPREVRFEVTAGTPPMYGRYILDFELVSPRELRVHLGIVAGDVDKHVSTETDIKITGDILKHITFEVDNSEFEALWIDDEE